MDNITTLFQSADIKKYVKVAATQLGTMIYNELYIYLWFICIYNVILIFLVLANLLLLIRLLAHTNIRVLSVDASCV